MTPFRAVFGCDTFEAWGELLMNKKHKRGNIPLPDTLAEYHRQSMLKGLKEKERAARYQDQSVKVTSIFERDRLLNWSENLEAELNRKFIQFFLGPNEITQKLSAVGYQLRFETCNKKAHVHANRKRRISEHCFETNDPIEGIYMDILMVLNNLSETKTVCDNEVIPTRMLKIQVKGRGSLRWTEENELPESGS